MNVLAYSNYLAHFASAGELTAWTAEVRSAVLSRIITSAPSETAWLAFLELLFFTPEQEAIKPIVMRSKAELQHWHWAIRQLDYAAPLLRRDNGIVLAVVGVLTLKDIEDLAGYQLQALAKNPQLGSLKALQLKNIETFSPHLAQFLATAPLAQLQNLELTKINLSGAISEVFGQAHLTALQELKLIAADLATADIAALVQLAVCDNLDTLSLASNYLNNADLALLLNCDRFTHLTTLDLSNTKVTATEFKQQIARRKLPALEKIILSGTPAAEVFGTEVRV